MPPPCLNRITVERAAFALRDTSRPVLEALGEAANEPLSAAVRAAAMETIGELCPDGAARRRCDKGAHDADGGV